MSKENRQAFLDFCRKNSLCLQETEKQQAIFAIRALISEKMKPKDVVARIVHSIFSDHLFEIAARFYCVDKTDRLEFLDALASLPARTWVDNVLGAERFGELFNEADDFEYLLKHFPAKLFDSGGPLYQLFSSDEYWRIRILRYSVKSDYRRAWDELRKADRGFFVGPEEEKPLFGQYDPEFYAYQARPATIDRLTRDLFMYMERDGLIELTEADVLAVNPDEDGGDRAATAMWRKLDLYWKGVRKVARRKKNEARVKAEVEKLQGAFDTIRRNR